MSVLKTHRSERTRVHLRERTKNVEAIVPSTPREMLFFLLFSVTAGMCEEFLFPGYLVWVLAPVFTWWGAGAYSLIAFAFGRGYQGTKARFKRAF